MNKRGRGEKILPDFNSLVEEIKSKRKRANLTQKELATRTGVSQSLIAKLEQKKNIPNYQTIKKIYDFLERKTDSEQTNAGELAHSEIVSISPKDKRKDATKLMNDNDLNAIPVKEDENFIGVVKNSSLTLISEETPVEEIINYSISIVPEKTSKEVIEKLFKYNDIILVKKEGKIKGFISEKDLI